MIMNSTTAQYDYLIIGAGPAGLQMGYYLEKNHENYVILETGDSAGTFFKKFPRHRRMISINKVITGFADNDLNLRWDWNSLLNDSEEMLFKNYTKQYFPKADDMVRYLNGFANHYELNIKYNTAVTRISKEDHFVVHDTNGNTYSCLRLIVATGLSKPYIPNIPGIEFGESYADVSVDPQDFEGQRVLIIGKGNSALETADNLVETTAALHLASPTPVRLAWKTHFVGHIRAVNNNILDTYQLKSQNTIIDANIEHIRKNNGKLTVRIKYTHASGQVIDIPVDRVIICSGFRFDNTIFDPNCRPTLAIRDKVPAMKSDWESTDVKDLYFIGSIMQMRDYQKTFSAFIHGFRYNIKALHQIFDIKYHGGAWPSTPIEINPKDILDATMKRIHTNSALFQQPAFFCDMIAISDHEEEGRYYQDLPIEYLHDSELGQHEHYYTITLEYGHEDHFDPFNIERKPEKGALSHFIHPVIRRFSKSELVSEYHVPEDLENNWYQEMYLQPYLAFLSSEIVGAPS